MRLRRGVEPPPVQAPARAATSRCPSRPARRPATTRRTSTSSSRAASLRLVHELDHHAYPTIAAWVEKHNRYASGRPRCTSGSSASRSPRRSAPGKRFKRRLKKVYLRLPMRPARPVPLCVRLPARVPRRQARPGLLHAAGVLRLPGWANVYERRRDVDGRRPIGDGPARGRDASAWRPIAARSSAARAIGLAIDGGELAAPRRRGRSRGGPARGLGCRGPGRGRGRPGGRGSSAASAPSRRAGRAGRSRRASTSVRRPSMSEATDGTPSAIAVASGRPDGRDQRGLAEDVEHVPEPEADERAASANVTRSAIRSRSARRRRSTSSSPWPAITNSASTPGVEHPPRGVQERREPRGRHQRPGRADHRRPRPGRPRSGPVARAAATPAVHDRDESGRDAEARGSGRRPARGSVAISPRHHRRLSRSRPPGRRNSSTVWTYGTCQCSAIASPAGPSRAWRTWSRSGRRSRSPRRSRRTASGRRQRRRARGTRRPRRSQGRRLVRGRDAQSDLRRDDPEPRRAVGRGTRRIGQPSSWTVSASSASEQDRPQRRRPWVAPSSVRRSAAESGEVIRGGPVGRQPIAGPIRRQADRPARHGHRAAEDRIARPRRGPRPDIAGRGRSRALESVGRRWSILLSRRLAGNAGRA